MGLSQCWDLGGLYGRLREVVYSVVFGVLGVRRKAPLFPAAGLGSGKQKWVSPA